MSYKSRRLDSFCNDGFQSVEMNAYRKPECGKHDPYLSPSFQTGRTYGSHDYFLLIFIGLIHRTDVVRIWTEATLLILYTLECRFNFKFHSCENTTLYSSHYLSPRQTTLNKSHSFYCTKIVYKLHIQLNNLLN